MTRSAGKLPTLSRLLPSSRRSFLAAAALASSGLSGLSPATSVQAAPAKKGLAGRETKEAQDARGYFPSLSTALKNHGVYQPTLVIDRDRLEANIAVMLSHLDPALNFRTVTKSLPIPDLLNLVRAKTDSNRLMVFNQPILNAVIEQWPDADILLGKPMPVKAAAAFFDGLRGTVANREWSVQWLVDSPARLAQYGELASQKGLTLDIALELDVGFHRGGLATMKALDESLALIADNPGLHLAGLMGYDAHVSIFSKYLGPPEITVPSTNLLFQTFIDRTKAQAGQADLTINTAGSTTYQLYAPGRFATPANDIAIGSGLLKPTFCDAALADHVPAAFIATPVLKRQDGVSVPGFEHHADGGAGDGVARGQTVFLYGGKWMAEPVYPSGMEAHPIYGRSSNQDMFNLPGGVAIEVDDLAFFRPTQTEMVLNQFRDILVVSDGKVVDSWRSW